MRILRLESWMSPRAQLAVQRAFQVDELLVGGFAALAECCQRGVLLHDFKDAGIYAPLVFLDEDLLAALPHRDVAVGGDEVRQVDVQEALGRSRRFFICGARSRMTCVSCAGVAVARSGERASAALGDVRTLCGNVGKQAHVFRNGLEQVAAMARLWRICSFSRSTLWVKVSAATSTSAANRRSGATWRRRKSSFAGVSERPEIVVPRECDLHPGLS